MVDRFIHVSWWWWQHEKEGRIKGVIDLKSQMSSPTPTSQRTFVFWMRFSGKSAFSERHLHRITGGSGFLESTFLHPNLEHRLLPSQSLSRLRHDKRSDSHPSTHLAFALPKEFFLLIVASWFLRRDQIPIVLFFLSSAQLLFFLRSLSFTKAYFYWVSLVFYFKEYLLWTLSISIDFQTLHSLFSLIPFTFYSPRPFPSYRNHGQLYPSFFAKCSSRKSIIFVCVSSCCIDTGKNHQRKLAPSGEQGECLHESSISVFSDQIFSLQSSMMLNDPLVKFQSSYEPDVSIEYYIQRIFKHSKCSDACLIIMLVYIDRLIENHGLVLTKLNAHRMIITSLMVAAKYHDDLFYNNAYFAKLGGIPLPELNMLEVEFLKLLDFSMFVHATLFEKYQSQLQSYQMYLQLQYSPSSTAVRPIGSPYSHQSENAFHFSPNRYVHDQSSNTGFFVAQQSSSPLETMNAPAFVFPFTGSSQNAQTNIPSPDLMQQTSASLLFDHNNVHGFSGAIPAHHIYHDQQTHQIMQGAHMVPVAPVSSLPHPIGHQQHSSALHPFHQHIAYATAGHPIHHAVLVPAAQAPAVVVVTPMPAGHAPTLVDTSIQSANSMSSSYPPSTFIPSLSSSFHPIHNHQPHYSMSSASLPYLHPAHLMQPYHSLVTVGF